MNYAEEIKKRINDTNTESVKAVIYARVSTDTDGQKESCANQVDLAKKYIESHPNIYLMNVYVDDGISGKNDFNRPQYNEMVEEIETGGVDLIITKALSRLNRDQLNSLQLTSILIEYNTTVLTLEDGQVHDFEDMNSDLLHSIKYAIDAQYVKQQSINGRKVQELRCERKELSAKDCAFGYDWHRDSKSITINEEQAKTVRRIYEEYVYYNRFPAQITRELNAEGITLCNRSVLNILRDERYIGKFYINKRTTKLGMGRVKSKRVKLPKEKWVLVERPDLQIVDPELFALAQRVYHARLVVYTKPDKKILQTYFQGTHKYAGKIFCGVCGKPFRFGYADRNKTIPIYRVGNHSNCSSNINRVFEEDLDGIVKESLKRIMDQQDIVFSTLEKVLLECVESSQKEGDTDDLKKQKTAREKQISKLLDTLSEDVLTGPAKARVLARINEITDEIDKLSEQIRVKEETKLDDSYVTAKMAGIRAAIADLRNFQTMDRERIVNYIDHIDILPTNDMKILLKSGHVILCNTTYGKENSAGAHVVKRDIQHGRC